ncbi:MAG: N-acetyltransferase [Candidatus Nanopelagicales bacterium]|nr:N-acetyltransferase [Candidatus Nanopelagicales bacterium]
MPPSRLTISSGNRYTRAVETYVQWPIPADTVLAGSNVTLTLAQASDAPDLFAVLDHDAVWTHVRGRPDSSGELAATLAAANEVGRWPWVVRQSGAVVGTTSYLEVSPIDARLEIAFTLYAPEVWGTVVNPECKLLLMTWAFEVAGMGRVQLKTDIRNVRSQEAIAHLGATKEGVLRQYQRRQDGSVRDTVMYSVLAQEWPALKAGLTERLGISN